MDSIDKSLAYRALANHIANFAESAMDGTPAIWDQLIDGDLDYDTPEDYYDGKYPVENTGVLEDSYERLKDIAVNEMFNRSHTDAITDPTINDRDPPSASRFEFPSDNGKCPHCGSNLTLKKGRFGDFYGCTSFPNCRYTCSKKQYEAAIKYAKQEEAFYGKPKEEPKKENPAIAEVKIEVKPQRKPFTGLCKEVEYKGGVYSDPFGIRCGDCVLFSHAKLKCIFRDWDTDKDRPGCDLFIPNSLDERLELLEYLKKIRDERKQNES